MNLKQLKMQVDKLEKLAGKDAENIPVRIAAVPNFPVSLELMDRLLSTLDGSLRLESVGGEPIVLFGEKNEIGPISGEIFDGFGRRK